MSEKRPGRLFVLSAPSGSGKTTVLARLMEGKRPIVRSVSVTTRLPRRGERDGRDYFFLTQAEFEQGIRRGEFLEHARVLGYRYGTPRAAVERHLRAGKDVVLCIDIQGARQIRRSGLPATTVFLVPPSLKVLQERLRRRGTEGPAQMRARLRLARRELREVGRYDYAVVNDRLEEAVEAVRTILRAERFRVRAKRRNGWKKSVRRTSW